MVSSPIKIFINGDLRKFPQETNIVSVLESLNISSKHIAIEINENLVFRSDWQETNLKDGDKVENPIFIQFGLSGKGVAPAGVDKENTGHHHLLINVKELDFSMPIPSSKNHLHFVGGQTETIIELPPGRHELQLVLGDLYHIPHSPPITSKKIKIQVQ